VNERQKKALKANVVNSSSKTLAKLEWDELLVSVQLVVDLPSLL